MEFVFGRAQARSSRTWMRRYARVRIYLWMQSYMDPVLNDFLRGMLLWEAQSMCVTCQPWDQAVPNPRGQNRLEMTSQTNERQCSPLMQSICTHLTEEVAAVACFRNGNLASPSHVQNMASPSQTTVLALWEPEMFYGN